MTLPAGTKLGPYEILVPLGAGGMGEVCRRSRLLGDLRPSGAPACGSRGCALDRKPGPSRRARSRGANLLPPFGRETIRAANGRGSTALMEPLRFREVV